MLYLMSSVSVMKPDLEAGWIADSEDPEWKQVRSLMHLSFAQFLKIEYSRSPSDPSPHYHHFPPFTEVFVIKPANGD